MIKQISERKTISSSILWMFLGIFIPLFSISLLVISAIYFSRIQASHAIKLSAEQGILSLQQKSINSDIRSIISDLKFFASNPHLQELNTNNSSGQISVKLEVEREFQDFSRAKQMYDQIRYLDSSGMERIRVNFNAGQPSIVHGTELQNKKGRYYFEEVLALDKNEVFISPLDLNVEQGQIEQPLKPTMRIGTPILDHRDQKIGIVLLNYFGSILLDRFSDLSIGSLGASFLLNSSGFYLHSDQPSLKWGFMYPGQDQADQMFSKIHPAAWSRIVQANKGQFENNEGLFTFETAYPLTVCMNNPAIEKSDMVSRSGAVHHDYFWKLVTFVPKNILYAESNSLKFSLGIFMLGMSVMIAFGAWKIALGQAFRKQTEVKRELLLKELESAYLQLKSSQSQLLQNEKMVSVGRLAAGVAHEINNPLAGIMQNAEVLTRRLTGDLPANHRAALAAGTTMENICSFLEEREVPRMLGSIRGSGNRAAAIVSNMLDFASNGKNTRSSHSLANLLDNSIDLALSDYVLTNEYNFRNTEILREYEEGLPQVSCEGGMLKQCVLNILRNCAEAMKDNDEVKKPVLIIRAIYERSAEIVRIEIEDTGCGMNKETSARVFDPFFTTKPEGAGTGLGLSSSYFIITELHGGEISVLSVLGQSTNTIIRLPIQGMTDLSHSGAPISECNMASITA